MALYIVTQSCSMASDLDYKCYIIKNTHLIIVVLFCSLMWFATLIYYKFKQYSLLEVPTIILTQFPKNYHNTFSNVSKSRPVQTCWQGLWWHPFVSISWPVSSHLSHRPDYHHSCHCHHTSHNSFLEAFFFIIVNSSKQTLIYQALHDTLLIHFNKVNIIFQWLPP